MHLAEMVSLLCPPPQKFLDRYEQSRKYWDSKGKCAPCAAPDTFSTSLGRADCISYRASAEDLYQDEFLNGFIRHEGNVAGEGDGRDGKD